jgi:NADH-quinone oxidoreductase subunit C
LEPIEIAEKIRERFPGDVIDIVSFRDQVSVVVSRDRIAEISRFVFKDPAIRMDMLSDLCGVDYPDRTPRFEIVYNLYSVVHRHRIRLKALVPEEDPRLASVVPIWSGADWHEREAYDLFGVVFEGHPDLRRILMPEDWEGHPLRKDYPVDLPAEREYRGYQEIRELHEHDDEWTIRG